MTALSASHGSRADFYIGTSGSPGTGVAISQYVNDAALPFQRDKAETSTFKQLFKSYVAGLIDLSIPFNGIADVNIDGQLYALLIMSGAGSAIQFQYAPLGVGTTGSALWTGFGFLDKYESKSALNAAYLFTANFQSTTVPARTIQ